MMGQVMFLADQIGQEAEQVRRRAAQRSTSPRRDRLSLLARALTGRRTLASR